MPTADQFLALSEENQEKEIKRHLHEIIFEGAPEVKEIAFRFGFKTPTKLYQWGSCKSDKLPRLRHLIKLMKCKNDLRILYFFNDLFNLTPFQRPKLRGTQEQDIGRRLSLIFREISSVCQAAIDLVEAKSSKGQEINWEKFREMIISAHEQLAALEEAVRIIVTRGMK